MDWPRRRGPGAVGMSLRTQLVAWVLLPQLVLWAAGGIATYRLAVRYVNQAADATLSQAARTLARQVKPIGSGLLIDFPRAAEEVLEADPNDRLLYTVSSPPGEFILGNDAIPAPPPRMTPRAGEPYFYDGELVQEDPRSGQPRSPIRVRVAALYLKHETLEGEPQWMLVQVARSTAARQTIWQSILLDTLLPLSGLILLMTLIVWIGTGAGLAPLLRLRREVEGRAAADLTPLQAEAAPEELRSLVHALNGLLASVRQSVEAQQRFIADAAHQLRTPLAGLKSQLEIALGLTTDPALAARLKLVHQSATRSTHLINRLLMLARAEPEAAMAQDTAPLDLAALVHQTVADAVPRALRAGADLGISEESGPAAETLWVRANAMLLTEALVNVIDNAIDYAGSGCDITVAVGREAGMARITVTDNGPGIAAADRARVFERFVRATETGLGCGLGLSIVKEIVRRHNGTVELADAHPHGLEVAIRLPLCAAPIQS
jgi:two-component system sensor histidine kinase TctE